MLTEKGTWSLVLMMWAGLWPFLRPAPMKSMAASKAPGSQSMPARDSRRRRSARSWAVKPNIDFTG